MNLENKVINVQLFLSDLKNSWEVFYCLDTFNADFITVIPVEIIDNNGVSIAVTRKDSAIHHINMKYCLIIKETDIQHYSEEGYQKMLQLKNKLTNRKKKEK